MRTNQIINARLFRSRPIDWNQDTLYLPAQPQDINGDGSNTALIASNDWATNNGIFTNLNFDFQCTSNFVASGPSFQQLLQCRLTAQCTQPAAWPQR